MPAFHEPGAGLEIIVNKDKYAELPEDLQEIIKEAAQSTALETMADYQYHNAMSLRPSAGQGRRETAQVP